MNKLLTEIFEKEEVNNKFAEAYKHVIANMEDESTKASAKRKITIEIIFEQDNGREFMDINTAIKETLAPKIFKVKVMESDRQIEGQMNVTDYEETEMAAESETDKALKALREKGVDVVDPTTGEVIN